MSKSYSSTIDNLFILIETQNQGSIPQVLRLNDLFGCFGAPERGVENVDDSGSSDFGVFGSFGLPVSIEQLINRTTRTQNVHYFDRDRTLYTR